MRLSCNGCRVLRKGCNDECSLRPCLQWIKSAESQANATLFLAKFYGRAGLFNLINAGPEHLRPAIFQSLLYEASGRIINPIYGSVGLMWSGNWHLCHAAVEAVLAGTPVMRVSIENDAAQAHPIMPLAGSDIRHLSRGPNGIHRVRTRNRFKPFSGSTAESTRFRTAAALGRYRNNALTRVPSHDSFSVQTVEASLANQTKLDPTGKSDGPSENQIVLELSLGLNPVVRRQASTVGERSHGGF